MNEAKLNEALAFLVDGMKQAGEFAQEQAPLYVQEYLQWEFTGNAMLAVVGFAMLIVAAMLSVAVHKVRKIGAYTRSDAQDAVVFFGSIGMAVCVIAGLLLSIVGIFSAIKVKIAPRVVIMEHISSLVKNEGSK